MEVDTTPRHVIVLGLGDSGLAMAAWCARLGHTVTVLDTRDQPPRLADLQTRVPQAHFRAGPFAASALDDVFWFHRESFTELNVSSIS